MSKLFIGKHSTWGIEYVAKSLEELKQLFGGDLTEVKIKEIEKSTFLLESAPQEFRATLSYMAYERGHSAGEDEVELVLEGLIADLSPAIREYTKRMKLAKGCFNSYRD